MEIKISKTKINQQLNSLIAHMAKTCGQYEMLAKCYLYISNMDKAVKFFDMSIIDYLNIPEAMIKNKWMKEILVRKTIASNLLRYLDQKDKMLVNFTELEPQYAVLHKKTNMYEHMGVHADFYFSWATINFHLGNYEKAVELGKLFKWKIPVAPCDYARGLLLNDKQIIEDTLEGIIKYIKNDRIQPFHWSNNVEDPWEWYEIGRQLLGLPSKLDEITEYIRTKDNN